MSQVKPASGPVPKPGRYVKVSLYLKKLPHVSDEHFHAYWANNHLVPALANKTFMSHVRRYNQHHITSELREKSKAFGIPVMEYDGIAEVWLDSLDDWVEICSDKEFQEVVQADEPNFLQAPIHIQVGYDTLIIGDDWKPVTSN